MHRFKQEKVFSIVCISRCGVSQAVGFPESEQTQFSRFQHLKVFIANDKGLLPKQRFGIFTKYRYAKRLIVIDRRLSQKDSMYYLNFCQGTCPAFCKWSIKLLLSSEINFRFFTGVVSSGSSSRLKSCIGSKGELCCNFQGPRLTA